MSRLDHLNRFYSSLGALENRVAGLRRLSDCSGRIHWPKRGIYFFTEPGENRTDSGHGPRIVRVGTHAVTATSKTTLWDRLYQHKGYVRSKGGNHRGSIFRLLVGTALIERDGLDFPTWNTHRNNAPPEIRERERPLERIVSRIIGEMPFIWLAIDDEPGRDTRRAYIERNAIALLSNYGKPPLDPPSRSWLGQHCSREKVRASGLWCSDDVDKDYDPSFLGILANCVDQMEPPE